MSILKSFKLNLWKDINIFDIYDNKIEFKFNFSYITQIFFVLKVLKI